MTVNSNANTVESSSNAEERIWIDLFQRRFAGDAIACLSIRNALETAPGVNGPRVSQRFGCKHRPLHFGNTDENPFLLTFEIQINQTPVAMPDDFNPLKTKFKVTQSDPTPVEDRMQLMSALDHRQQHLRGTAILGTSCDKFLEQLQTLRVGVNERGQARIEALLICKLNQVCPHLEAKGQPIKTSPDFMECTKKGACNNKKREVVLVASSEIWNDNNQLMINLEKELCAMNGIKFAGLEFNGVRMPRNHRGQCIHSLLVKVKGSMATRICDTCECNIHACCCHRMEADKPVGMPTGEPKAKSTSKSRHSRKKRKMPSLMHQEECTIASHGFEGKIGLMEGHPILATELVKKAAPTEAVFAQNQELLMSPVTASMASLASSERSPKNAEITSPMTEHGCSTEEMNPLLVAHKSGKPTAVSEREESENAHEEAVEHTVAASVAAQEPELQNDVDDEVSDGLDCAFAASP